MLHVHLSCNHSLMLKEQYLIRLLDSFHLLTSFPNSFFLFSLNQADDSFFYKNINKNYVIKYLQKSNSTSIFNWFIFKNCFPNKIFSRRNYRLNLLITLNMGIFHSLSKLFHYIKIWILGRIVFKIFIFFLINIMLFTFSFLCIDLALFLLCKILIIASWAIVLCFLYFLRAKLFKIELQKLLIHLFIFIRVPIRFLQLIWTILNLIYWG